MAELRVIHALKIYPSPVSTSFFLLKRCCDETYLKQNNRDLRHFSLYWRKNKGRRPSKTTESHITRYTYKTTLLLLLPKYTHLKAQTPDAQVRSRRLYTLPLPNPQPLPSSIKESSVIRWSPDNSTTAHSSHIIYTLTAPHLPPTALLLSGRCWREIRAKKLIFYSWLIYP